MARRRGDYDGMARKRRRTGDDVAEYEKQPLFIGLWITRLGRRQVDIAKAIGIGESHLSNIINGIPKEAPKRPSYPLLFAIADELKITVDDLRRRPPGSELMEAVQRLSPQARNALLGPPTNN